MRFISPDETKILEGKFRRDLDRIGRPKTVLYYHSTPRNYLPAAELITSSLDEFDQAILIFLFSISGSGWSETEISDERWQRYRAWRKNFGESRRLYEAPGHVAEKGEAAEFANLIEFALN